MTHRQYLALFILAAFMAVAAFGMGKWAEKLNPEGIVPHTPVASEATTADTSTSSANTVSTPQGSEVATAASTELDTPRSAFTFGASMGLLAVGLLYCVLAAGLLLRQRARGLPANRFIVCLAGLAVSGFALSYLIDDYFY